MADEKSLKVGDCVQLMAGGCLMTVSSDKMALTYFYVDCQWFNDEGELKVARFDTRSLRRWVLATTSTPE